MLKKFVLTVVTSAAFTIVAGGSAIACWTTASGQRVAEGMYTCDVSYEFCTANGNGTGRIYLAAVIYTCYA
jgi:hypothetical protein